MAQSAYRIISCLSRTNSRLLTIPTYNQIMVRQDRGRKRWHKPYYRALYWRRLTQGPEPERHRSVWLNWNYDSEIYAFGKRLHEDFNETTLKTAFTHSSYAEKEQKIREGMELGEEMAIEIQDNTELIHTGEVFTTNHIKAYLRHSYPALPEEGICAVSDYLLSDEMMTDIGTKLGIKDLILCAEFPPSTKTCTDTFKAVIGGLVHDQGSDQAGYFVEEFIITMLVGKDVMELWNLVNPMGVLQSVVEQQQQGFVESRLLFDTGSNTVMAAYMVGVYSDKQLLGKGYGETVNIAEEMAARDALRPLFGTTLNKSPLPFNKTPRLMLDSNRVNISVKDYLSPSQLQ